ncbi:MAG: DUF1592 domain-containing protein [Planctomycetaceae bacterium]|nr:DUF1592 domain-containing protein [Planctomycetaceae bacterium]
MRALVLLSLLFPAVISAAPKPEAADHFETEIRPLLLKYCAACHDPEEQENAAPFLRAKTVDQIGTFRSLWSSAAEQLQNRTMPPADEEQPTEAERLKLSTWIEETLEATACSGDVYAGRVVTRRLNRREYDNTIRDLLGVDLKASEKFPVDGSGGEGFDNNGETLFLPTMLMERYLTAASEALDAAIISPPLKLSYLPNDFLPASDKANAKVRSLPEKTQINVLATIFNDRRYQVRILVKPVKEQGAKLIFKLDGIAAERFEIKDASLPQVALETSVRLARGNHVLSLRSPEGSELEVVSLEVTELRPDPSPEYCERHQRLLQLEPDRIPESPHEHARQVLSNFLPQAFRRPVTNDEIEKYLSLYQRGEERGDPFTESMKLALRGVLVSPHFLFRIESEPQSDRPERLNDYELASRLSYFLWSTMPDEELFELAAEGKLQQPGVLKQQIERMLDDPKAEQFAFEFIGQWLGTKEVGALVAPDTGVFSGEFTTELLFDLQEEPVYFFRYLLAENRSLLELIDSDYAIVNKRLSGHYGFDEKNRPKRNPSNPWVQNPKRGSGGPFEKVMLPDDKRGGVLGMGGVHMVTSYPTRTSPVLRGGWILETMLGVRVPSPPPDVPEIKRGKNSELSTREILKKHRESPSCAACHNLMDPLGFALDNFDVLGRWRDKEGKAEIDASASLPSGESFTGPEGLRQVLLGRQDDFLHHLTRKMLGYALGRSLTDFDDCTIQKISQTVSESGFQSRTLVREIVLSPPFRSQQRTENMLE